MRTPLVRVMVVALASLVVLCTGCPRPVGGVRLNREAQIYIKYNQIDKAQELLRESIDNDFENSASHYWMGWCYEQKGAMLKAIYEYELAVRFTPSMELAQVALVRALHRGGQQENSLQAARNFMESAEGATRDYMRIARIFWDEQMDEQAIVVCEAAARAVPDNGEPMLAVAEYYLRKGDTKKGVDYMIRAFKMAPNSALAKRLGEYGMKVDAPEPKLIQPMSPLEKEIHQLEN